MQEIIQNKDFSVDEFQTLIALMKKYGGIAYTEQKAIACIEKAKESLSIFEPSKIKESLIDIADYVMARRI